MEDNTKAGNSKVYYFTIYTKFTFLVSNSAL